MIWVGIHPQFHPDMLGFIPQFLSERDPRPAKEQFNTNYQSGWDAQPGFTMAANGNLLYPGDPPLELLAETRLRNETIRFYNYAYVAIVQEDGTFEACRMD